MSGDAWPVRWRSIDRRGIGHTGGVAAGGLQRLVEQRYKAGDRSLVATLNGEEVAWITRVDGRRTYSYDRCVSGEVHGEAESRFPPSPLAEELERELSAGEAQPNG